MPVEGIISGVYGSQRILNGKPRWPHYGIDIAAKRGTMIKSSGSGVVTMAENDLYYTGGTIIMDHGHGISTIYSHLETILVSVNDKINQGDIIGTVGSTGRSTGPHLDFRVNWFQTRLDPMSVINWNYEIINRKTSDKLVNAFLKNKIISPIPSKFTKKLKEAQKLRLLCENKIKLPVIGFKAAGTGIPLIKKLKEKEPFYASVYKKIF